MMQDKNLKRKKKSKIYFGKETQDAIIRYVELNKDQVTNLLEKNKLYKNIIHPAFDKLCENVINTWKFHEYETSYEDLKTDAISELYVKMDKFNPEKGRAYSYFTIIARNFCIIKSREIVKQRNNQDTLDVVDVGRNLHVELSRASFNEDITAFASVLYNTMDSELDDLFPIRKQRRIADSILELFKNSRDIDIFNKKILYIYIRERSNVDTKDITAVTNILKPILYKKFNNYREFLDINITEENGKEFQ